MPTPTDLRGRFKQANREALFTLGLYVFFFLWWTLFAFGLGLGDPNDYSYVFGMPAWFFYSCVLGYPVVTILLWYVLRRYFSDMPLDVPSDINQDDTNQDALSDKDSRP